MGLPQLCFLNFKEKNWISPMHSDEGVTPQKVTRKALFFFVTKLEKYSCGNPIAKSGQSTCC